MGDKQVRTVTEGPHHMFVSRDVYQQESGDVITIKGGRYHTLPHYD